MAGLTRTVHVQWAVSGGPMEQIAPGVKVGAEDGEEPPPMFALAFKDESDTHVYLMSAEQRQELSKMLAGGIEIARAIPE